MKTSRLKHFIFYPITKTRKDSKELTMEIGHMAILNKMELKPIFDLNLRLGEGTGAALAMLMIEAGLKIYNEMATFEGAGVAGKQ